MNFKVLLAVTISKICQKALRVTGRGATSLPGKAALKVCPDLLGHLSKGVTTIIVTGTNGKTTTSRMIEQAMKDCGVSFFCNKSGANLLQGITNEFINNSNFKGECSKKYALIECDEAAFKTVSRYVDAKCILVTNLFRDQLDRYGEVAQTLKNIRISINNSPNAIVCLNSDCSMTASLAESCQNKVVFYGINVPMEKGKVKEVLDVPYCINCKHEFTYDYITYGHLGKYHCDNCGYSRPHPSVFVDKVYVSDDKHSEVSLFVDREHYDATVNLPGSYNIYNGVASVSVSHAMGFNINTAVEALSKFECGFGRMEEFKLDGVSTRMILIKNPAGCNQVLNYVSNFSTRTVFAICLNDNYGDGTDISWIWDVDFEVLERIGEKLSMIVCSGTRANDMAVRLRYAGISDDKIRVVKDYDELLNDITAQSDPVCIMPTYTAMMELRAKVSKKYGYKNFWE